MTLSDVAPDAQTETAQPARPRWGLLGRALGWVQADHLRRGPILLFGGVYGTAAAAHAYQVPAALGVAGAAMATVSMYARAMNLPGAPRPVLTAAATAAAGGWVAAAMQWGVTAGPYGLTTWLGLAAGGCAYRAYRVDPAIREALAWEQAKAEWHLRAPRYGLRGSHLLAWRETRLGEQFELDTVGTGKRASQLVGGDIEERIAEQEGLPTSRVKVRLGAIAGRVKVSLRYKNPWAEDLPHPRLDAAPEIPLPQVADVREPVIIGMDPESGRPLEVLLWDEDGARRVLIVATTGGGKTVTLSDVTERVTAADNAWGIGINVSKAKELRRWRRALGASACGPAERVKALRLLEMGRHIIDYRGSLEYGDDATVEPTPDTKLVVFLIDELAALLGPSDPIGLATRRELAYIHEKGRSEAVAVAEVGLRGTVSNIGSGDIRAMIDQVLIGKVNRRSEMQHAVGDLGLILPDMARYGEGKAGVVLTTELGGDWHAGRTWRLDKLTDIDRLAAGRAAGELEPGLMDYLRAKMGAELVDRLRSDEPWQPSRTAPRPAPAAALEAAPAEESAPADTGTAAAQRARAAVLLAESAVPLDTTLTPGELRATAIARRRQAAEQTDIPPELRALLLRLLAQPDGTTTRAIEAAMEAAGHERGISKSGAWRCLDALRFEGVAEVRGRGRGARWHLVAPAVKAPEQLPEPIADSVEQIEERAEDEAAEAAIDGDDGDGE